MDEQEGVYHRNNYREDILGRKQQTQKSQGGEDLSFEHEGEGNRLEHSAVHRALGEQVRHKQLPEIRLRSWL